MEESIALLTTILRRKLLRVTNPRRAVFLALLHKPPQTIGDIIQTVHPAVDRVSVYRTIQLFEALGIVQRITIGWKYTIELTDVFSHHHHHAICTQCGRIIDLPENKEIELLIARLTETHHIKTPTHTLEIRGICQRCSNIKPLANQS